MLNNFKDHIIKNLPFLNESKLLIAISGGLDSVVLTQLCKDSGFDIALAHCNFKLRNDESDEDEAFVEGLASTLDIELFVQRFETQFYAETHKLSIQMAARELRYQWFKELAIDLDYDYILTAHHADDSLETVLINLSRGTGLEGLTGIPEVNETIVRPLLPFSRTEIERYAKNNKISWREDSSNASTKYLRNGLRHEVIPKLKALQPELLQSLTKTQANLEEARVIVETTVAKLQKKIMTVEDDVIKFKIKPLKKIANSKPYIYQLLKAYNFTQWDDIIDLLDAQSGKQVFSNTHRLIKNRKYLLLTKINKNNIKSHNEKAFVITETTRTLKTPAGILFFDEADALFRKRTDVVFVDKALLKFPLIVRPWKKGDYFYPFGMQGKKKLSKFFKDEKLSLLEKEAVLVLCSGETIVWVINRRLDDRFKVTNTTKQSLKITIK